MNIDDPRIAFLLDSVEDWVKRIENASAQNAETAQRIEHVVMQYEAVANHFEVAARQMQTAATNMSNAAGTMYVSRH